MDGRDSMLAVAMNGQEPLPFEHGFPVRMLVPGLYGYESATKWVVDLELTTLRQPTRQIGAAAIAAMLDRVARADLPTRDILLHGTLVVRRSCGAPETAAPAP